MKKTISIMLSLLIALSGCFVAYGQSSNPAEIYLNVSYDKVAVVGSTITVTVSLDDNPGFCGAEFVLGYDKSVLECTEAKAGKVLEAMTNITNNKAEEGAIVLGVSVSVNKLTGTLATYKFKVLKEGDYGFSLSRVTFSDYDCNELEVSSNIKIVKSNGNSQGSQNTEKPSENPSQKPDEYAGNNPEVIQNNPDEGNSGNSSFIDTTGTWAETYIEKAVSKGFIEGYGNGKYGPFDGMTRAQFVTILYRSEVESLNEDTSYYEGAMPFSDTQSGQWDSKAIVWAAENKIVNGVGEGRFAPNEGVTREQIATILFRLAGEKVGGELMFYDIYDKTFTDSKFVSDWAKKAVYWSVYNEVLCGKLTAYVEKELNPTDKADRAQISVIMVKFDEWKGGQKQ